MFAIDSKPTRRFWILKNDGSHNRTNRRNSMHRKHASAMTHGRGIVTGTFGFPKQTRSIVFAFSVIFWYLYISLLVECVFLRRRITWP